MAPMQETDLTTEHNPSEQNATEQDATDRRRPLLRRLMPVYLLGIVMVLTALIVPLINVNRFQRRIVTSLSESIGRPIHLDNISLTVFPLPGLTIENLVVAEDPAFGSEPFIRASAVNARLRISSLWRRRIEFTRISFTDPSVNLARNSQGQWNLESILLQAARIKAAPTAQAKASEAPRFPYIEATGARMNLKMDHEKTPFSLNEANLSLSLDTPEQWQLRLEGRPVRTDTSVSDTGTLKIEGTLGRAATLNAVPVELRAEWRDAPLGEASRMMLGRDAGMRGTMTLSTLLRGTLGRGALEAKLHLSDVRRAEFVPPHTLSVDVECHATQSSTLRSIADIRCSWPPQTVPATGAPVTIALTGSIPDTRDLASSSFQLGTPGIPAATLLDWVHVASARFGAETTATGSLTGSLALGPGAAAAWTGQVGLAEGTLTVPSVAETPVFAGAVSLHSTPVANSSQFVLAPITLTLGGRDFATLDGRFDSVGYSLHLTGTAQASKLMALGHAIPELGDGLDAVLPPVTATTSIAPLRFDLTSTRSWGGPQGWQGSRAAATVPRHFLHR